jgi:hypothetical protein
MSFWFLTALQNLRHRSIWFRACQPRAFSIPQCSGVPLIGPPIEGLSVEFTKDQTFRLLQASIRMSFPILWTLGPIPQGQGDSSGSSIHPDCLFIWSYLRNQSCIPWPNNLILNLGTPSSPVELTVHRTPHSGSLLPH